MFVGRREELEFLNNLLTRNRPGTAQQVLMIGRRRVGKSELLLQWARQSGVVLNEARQAIDKLLPA